MNIAGLIADTHLKISNLEEDGPKSEKALELAQLHSIAVDFAKTGALILLDFFFRFELKVLMANSSGVHARINKEELLRVPTPDFMYGGIPEDASSENTENDKILGLLYHKAIEFRQKNSPSENQIKDIYVPNVEFLFGSYDDPNLVGLAKFLSEDYRFYILFFVSIFFQILFVEKIGNGKV